MGQVCHTLRSISDPVYPRWRKAGVTWSRARSPSMRCVAAFCTCCRGAVIDLGRPAKIKLPLPIIESWQDERMNQLCGEILTNWVTHMLQWWLHTECHQNIKQVQRILIYRNTQTSISQLQCKKKVRTKEHLFICHHNQFHKFKTSWTQVCC